MKSALFLQIYFVFNRGQFFLTLYKWALWKGYQRFVENFKSHF